MYWNAYKVTGIVVIAWININMRCIEIGIGQRNYKS